MELKQYQQHHLDEIDRYLTIIDQAPKHDYCAAFRTFWRTNSPAYEPRTDTAIAPYRNNVRNAPHICCKVPTGGGKTLLGAAALRVIFNHIRTPYQMVVWLVPSTTILEQTLRNLQNTRHPYRQRIDINFNSRVKVFDKQQALLGQDFSLNNVQNNYALWWRHSILSAQTTRMGAKCIKIMATYSHSQACERLLSMRQARYN